MTVSMHCQTSVYQNMRVGCRVFYMWCLSPSPVSLEKVNCPICDSQMTQLKNVRLTVEFDVIQPSSHEKFPSYMFVCKGCHNIQTFWNTVKESKNQYEYDRTLCSMASVPFLWGMKYHPFI